MRIFNSSKKMLVNAAQASHLMPWNHQDPSAPQVELTHRPKTKALSN